MSDDNSANRSDVDPVRRSLLTTSAAIGGLSVLPTTSADQESREQPPSEDTGSETDTTTTPEEFIEAASTAEFFEAVTAVNYSGVNSQITTFDTSIQEFPLHGDEFSVMSSGVAEDAQGDPSEFVSTDVEGVSEPNFSPDGFDAFNVATLSIDISVPENAENLAFDYRFGTVENPTFLDDPFQDFFEAIIFEPDGAVEPIGLLPDGSAVTVDNADEFSNSPEGESGDPAPPLPDPPDTTYNAVTEFITASYNLSDVEGEMITLVLRIGDASDGVLDSGVFIDNLRFTGDVEDPGLGAVEAALGDYREAAANAIEADVRAQAKLEAAFFEREGAQYASNSTDFWGFIAGQVSEDELDDELLESIESQEGLFESLEEEAFGSDVAPLENQAEMLYEFKQELYEALATASNAEETAFEYYMGTASGQTNKFLVDDQTYSEYLATFESEFETEVADEILDTLDQEDPDEGQISRLADSLESAATEFSSYSDDVLEDADQIVADIDAEGDEVDLEISASELELTDPVDAGVGPETQGTIQPQLITITAGAVGYGIGAGAYYGAKKLGGYLLVSSLAVGAVLTAWAAMSHLILTKTVKSIKWAVKEVLKEWAKEQAKRTLERNLIPESIDAQIEHVETPDITADDIEEEGLLSSWWDTLLGFVDAIFGTNWSRVEFARETASITITNTGEETFYPVFDIDIVGFDPQSGPTPVGLQPDRWSETPALNPVEVGETKTYEFEYRVPFDDFSSGTITVSVSDLYQVSDASRRSSSFEIEEDTGFFSSSSLFSGGIDEGETEQIDYTPGGGNEVLASDDPIQSVFIEVTYDDQYLDLRVIDEDGNVTGFAPDVGDSVVEIPNSEYSGRDTGEEGTEWVLIDEIGSTEFNVEVDAPVVTTIGADGIPTAGSVSIADDTGAVQIEGDVDVTETQERPASLRFDQSNITFSSEPETEITTTLSLSETNGDNAVDSAELSASDLAAGNETIDADAVTLDPDSVTVSADSSTTVELAIAVPDDIAGGTYEGTISADADDSSDELSVTIQIDGEEPALTDYANEDGVIDALGLNQAFTDWQSGEIDAVLLADAFSAWQSGEPVE